LLSLGDSGDTPGKFPETPWMAFVLGHSTVCFTSAHMSCSSPQQIAHWVPLFLRCRSPPRGFCAEDFRSPTPTGGASCWSPCLAPALGSTVGSAGSVSLQTFLRVFCCFNQFRFSRVLVLKVSALSATAVLQSTCSTLVLSSSVGRKVQT
jgi:hypothetical protein